MRNPQHDATMASFSLEDAVKAGEEWGANCGPGALAAVLGLSLDAVRPHLVGFDQKRYTNPAMMRGALRSLKADCEWRVRSDRPYLPPIFGLGRVQWDGPWTKAGVPPRAAYRHTHWIGSRVVDHQTQIFDINAICVGGWIAFSEWQRRLVPWLLKQVEPKASGEWWFTHLVEMRAADAARQWRNDERKKVP